MVLFFEIRNPDDTPASSAWKKINKPILPTENWPEKLKLHSTFLATYNFNTE